MFLSIVRNIFFSPSFVLHEAKVLYRSRGALWIILFCFELPSIVCTVWWCKGKAKKETGIRYMRAYRKPCMSLSFEVSRILRFNAPASLFITNNKLTSIEWNFTVSWLCVNLQFHSLLLSLFIMRSATDDIHIFCVFQHNLHNILSAMRFD